MISIVHVGKLNLLSNSHSFIEYIFTIENKLTTSLVLVQMRAIACVTMCDSRTYNYLHVCDHKILHFQQYFPRKHLGSHSLLCKSRFLFFGFGAINEINMHNAYDASEMTYLLFFSFFLISSVVFVAKIKFHISCSSHQSHKFQCFFRENNCACIQTEIDWPVFFLLSSLLSSWVVHSNRWSIILSYTWSYPQSIIMQSIVKLFCIKYISSSGFIRFLFCSLIPDGQLCTRRRELENFKFINT